MEWLNYFIKKAFEEIDAESEKQAHLFLMVEHYKWASLQYEHFKRLQVY